MEAIILAAGVGRRLSSLDSKSPKCLLRFNGRSLLDRHLANLEALGVERVWVVVGHMPAMIEEEIVRYQGSLEVRTVLNEQYRLGSILSLKSGLDAQDGKSDVIIMDADVLYHRDVLGRLLEADFDNGFLLDPRSQAAGEEMMLGVREGRVHTISRGVGSNWDLLGEGVGFFRLSAGDRPLLLQAIEQVKREIGLDADYEQALDAFLKERPAGFILVADLPWTEIDFDADVERAEREVLPAIGS